MRFSTYVNGAEWEDLLRVSFDVGEQPPSPSEVMQAGVRYYVWLYRRRLEDRAARKETG